MTFLLRKPGASRRSRPISGSSLAISGPCSRPVSARRSGWNSARPLRPVAALTASVQASRSSSSQARPAAAAAARQQSGVLDHRRERPAHDRRPDRASASVARLPRTARQNASPRSARSRQARAHRVVGQAVHSARVERAQLLRREARRGAADLGEIDGLRPARRARLDRLDRIGRCRAAPAARRSPAARCRCSRSSRSDSEPSRLDRPPPGASTSSGKCAKAGTARAQRLEDLDLRAGVGDVVLAADHVGDAEVDVVDHRGQRVEIGAVLADQHRIALARTRRYAAAPRTRSFQRTSPGSSLKRQCGVRPSASSRARSARSAAARRGRRSAAGPAPAAACA